MADPLPPAPPPGGLSPPGAPAAHPTPEDPPQRICRSDEIAERGLGTLFDVLEYRRVVRAFALRIDGRVVAYLNRCAHVPAEMDWQPGHFLDDDRRYILCSIHGAAYLPEDGRCAGGPCGRGRLTPLRVEEVDGEVYWYPSRDIRPLPQAVESKP